MQEKNSQVTNERHVPAAAPIAPQPDSGKKLSRYEKLSLWINAIGSILIAASVLAAFSALRLSIQQTSLTAHQNAMEPIIAIDKVFVDTPEIREYFYDGKDIKEDEPNYKRAEAVAEMHLDVFDFKLRAKEKFGDLSPFPETLDIWVRDMMVSSPIICKRLEKKKQWYSPRLHQVAKEAQAAK